MKLLIVIPALDEEDSIRSIIERALAARDHIIGSSPVTQIEITVVSDGSTDKTVEYARAFEDQIDLIVFENNRGYGAAIMEGWLRSDADLLSFLDADGTCDPRMFAPMCNVLAEQEADVVLGCRLNPDSQMPLIRRIGNTLFAWTLSVFSMRRIRDVASGMRVVRRSSLGRLLPLPTGLHFTPAMSARAILSRDVRIVEIDMPYHEREGDSKLHPFRDGIRFLRVILQTAFLHRPSRPMGLVALFLLAVAAILMVGPTAHWMDVGRVEDWMIYRFIVAHLLSTVAVLISCTSYLGRKAADIALSNTPGDEKYHGVWGWLFGRRWFWCMPALLTLIGVGFVAEALWEFLRTGEIHLDTSAGHWSRFVAMTVCLSIAAIPSATKIADWSLNLLADRLQFTREYAQRDDE